MQERLHQKSCEHHLPFGNPVHQVNQHFWILSKWDYKMMNTVSIKVKKKIVAEMLLSPHIFRNILYREIDN